MTDRDERADRLEPPLNGPVSGSVSNDLNRQHPAEPRDSLDFIVVPTVRFRLLYVWFGVGHGRREIIP
jgi:hypothetical protein